MQSFLIENNAGELIFKIEIANIDCSAWLDYTCVIDIAFDKYTQMKKSFEVLSSEDITLATKMKIIQEFMLLVKTIEVIKDSKNWEGSEEEEEPTAELKLQKFLVDFAIHCSVEQYAPLLVFNKTIHFRKYVSKFPLNLN